MREHRIDLLLLAECSFAEAKVMHKLNNALPWVPHQSSSLKFFTSLPGFAIINNQNSEHLAIARLNVGSAQLLLAGIHAESKLYADEIRQLDLADEYRHRISEQESFFGPRTIIFGDFNLNPYNLAMTHRSRGFSAVATQQLAQYHRNRSVVQHGQKIPRRYFYNPMWSFLGDLRPQTTHTKVPGTYLRSPRRAKDTHWNCLDGVLVSPEALHCFDAASLEIITATAGVANPSVHVLFDSTLRSGYSDHLPLRFSLHNL